MFIKSEGQALALLRAIHEIKPTVPCGGVQFSPFRQNEALTVTVAFEVSAELLKAWSEQQTRRA